MEAIELRQFKQKHLKQMICYEGKKATYGACSEVIDGVGLSFIALFILTNQSFFPNSFWTWFWLILGVGVVMFLRFFKSIQTLFFFFLFLCHMPLVDFSVYHQGFEWFPEGASVWYRFAMLVLACRFIWGICMGLLTCVVTPLLIRHIQKRTVNSFQVAAEYMSENPYIEERFSTILLSDLQHQLLEENWDQTLGLFEGTILSQGNVLWLIDALKDFPLEEMELLEIKTLSQFLSYFQ